MASLSIKISVILIMNYILNCVCDSFETYGCITFQMLVLISVMRAPGAYQWLRKHRCLLRVLPTRECCLILQAVCAPRSEPCLSAKMPIANVREIQNRQFERQ